MMDKLQDFKILYIEDDLEIRGYFSEFLKRYCKRVYECSTVEKGEELYRKHTPDILLLDINLPGVSGIEFASKIREKDTLTRILMSTAYTDTEFMVKAVELDITRYLVKPVSGSELLEALQKALEQLDKKSKKYGQKVDLGKGFVYHLKNKSITKDEKIINLRKKEIELLEFFLKYSSEIITYDRFENQLWYGSVMTGDSIRGQVKNLRLKTYPTLVENISGVGYRFAHDLS